MTSKTFRSFIPGPSQTKLAGPTARSHAAVRQSGERAHELFGGWSKLYETPFAGITTDGQVIEGLFHLRPEGAPTSTIVDAAHALIGLLTPEQRERTIAASDSRLWRNWQNTEVYVETRGLRLDEATLAQRDAAMAMVRASLSAKGFEVTRNVMRMNRFLGDLIGGPGVLGEWSYTVNLFGMPSTTEPWGWQLFGHHLCLNCRLIGTQMVLTPAFMGAEPIYADAGPFAGISLFEDEERSGLALMRALTRSQQDAAIVAHSMMGGDLPPGRRHFADNLTLGGAYQDNRIVPYEGLKCSDMNAGQRRRLLDLVDAYLVYMPDGPRSARMADFDRHLADAHFCWIGGTGDTNPFYYRIQSPVTFIEFDHHSGVFLTNAEPQKFHVHTIVRTPNGNDYGFDVLKQHYDKAHRHHHHHGHGHDHDRDHDHDHHHHHHHHHDRAGSQKDG